MALGDAGVPCNCTNTSRSIVVRPPTSWIWPDHFVTAKRPRQRTAYSAARTWPSSPRGDLQDRSLKVRSSTPMVFVGRQTGQPALASTGIRPSRSAPTEDRRGKHSPKPQLTVVMSHHPKFQSPQRSGPRSPQFASSRPTPISYMPLPARVTVSGHHTSIAHPEPSKTLDWNRMLDYIGTALTSRGGAPC